MTWKRTREGDEPRRWQSIGAMQANKNAGTCTSSRLPPNNVSLSSPSILHCSFFSPHLDSLSIDLIFPVFTSLIHILLFALLILSFSRVLFFFSRLSSSFLGHFGALAEDLVHNHGVLYVCSAGNEGPALSTIGAPPSLSPQLLIGVGAHVSPEMSQVRKDRWNVPMWKRMEGRKMGRKGLAGRKKTRKERKNEESFWNEDRISVGWVRVIPFSFSDFVYVLSIRTHLFAFHARADYRSSDFPLLFLLFSLLWWCCQALYSLRKATLPNQYTWSSRGPTVWKSNDSSSSSSSDSPGSERG